MDGVLKKSCLVEFFLEGSFRKSCSRFAGVMLFSVKYTAPPIKPFGRAPLDDFLDGARDKPYQTEPKDNLAMKKLAGEQTL